MQGKGFVKVFLSSTFKDLKKFRSKIIVQLEKSLESAAMEKFIPSGVSSHKIIRKEIADSDISLFLISSNFGTRIRNCNYASICKSKCLMKNPRRAFNTSYTWCEYNLSKNKPHSCYVVKSKDWEEISRSENSCVFDYSR